MFAELKKYSFKDEDKQMKPIEIAKGIYDVGVNDWNIDDFHGYSTPLGTSYNAFLIVDEKVALIDTVKSPLPISCLPIFRQSSTRARSTL